MSLAHWHQAYLKFDLSAAQSEKQNIQQLPNNANTTQYPSEMTLSLPGPLIRGWLKGKVGLSIVYTKTIKSTMTTAIFHQQHAGQRGSDGGMLCVGVNAVYSLSLCVQRTGSIGKTCHTWSMWAGVPCKEGSAVQCWINPHRPSSESLWVHSNRLLTDDKPFTTYHYRHFCGYNINKCQNNSSSKCKLRQETNRKPR